MAKKLQNAVKQFQDAQSTFSKEMKHKTARQLKITCPEKNEAEIEEMIRNGDTRETQVCLMSEASREQNQSAEVDLVHNVLP